MKKGSKRRRVRGQRWIEEQRSPRYDIWVGRTQVADPRHYRPACMTLWDEALTQPLTELGGRPAGDVLETLTAGVERLKAQPPSLDRDTALRALKWMHHLCSVFAEEKHTLVRVELQPAVSHYELVAGVLSGVITAEDAVRVAGERIAREADARKTLNIVQQVLADEEKRLRAHRSHEA
ncbi:hypothetical protein ABZ897_53740 [Nonomuraea sp. NPDC046802]|uniref:hypothetical protein n=1 Tax=Nonomuraea sp. NPDC046802 TaxID=3154919 RepID=UPI0033C0226B